jgi:hypothetical protein
MPQLFGVLVDHRRVVAGTHAAEHPLADLAVEEVTVLELGEDGEGI